MRRRVRKKLIARYGARTYAGAERAKRRWLLWQQYRREALDALGQWWRTRINAVFLDQTEHP